MASRGLLGAVPFVGAGLAELIGLVPKLRQDRAIRFIIDLAKRMDELGAPITI